MLKLLSANEVKSMMDEGTIVLDVRHGTKFGQGHVPYSYGIRVDAPLTTWAGWLIPFGSKIILVGESTDQIVAAIRQLIRIGYDELVGTLEGGIEAWAREYPVETMKSMTVHELRERLGEVMLIDVRQRSEWDQGHIPGAIHFEGGRVAWEDLPFPHDKPLAIQCSSGNRSMAVSSVLRRRGYQDVIQVEGGIRQWEKNGFETLRENSKA
jgi:hydroxyacylglutathione hydrolase